MEAHFKTNQQVYQSKQKNSILKSTLGKSESFTIPNKNNFSFSLIKQNNNHPKETNILKPLQIVTNQKNNNLAHQQNTDVYQILQNRLLFLQNKVKDLQNKLRQQDLIISMHQKKKMRRKATQIERRYQCHIQQCGKVYGSHTSLKNHLKLKHSLKVHKQRKIMFKKRNN